MPGVRGRLPDATSPASATASTSTWASTGTAARGSARSASAPGSSPLGVDHGLGAVFTDVDDDGRLDLYVANDLDPNRLYLNVARETTDRRSASASRSAARSEGVDDPNAGMGIAAADYSLDGRDDLFVTNSRRQLHAVVPQRTRDRGAAFADARPDFAAALGKDYTGWGVSWIDLDLDGNLDLVLANGAIPVLNLEKDAQRIQVLENLTGEGRARRVRRRRRRRRDCPPAGASNGRGLAAADYDNDGDVDVAINSIGGRLILLRNTGAAGHWLEVKLRGFAPGRQGHRRAARRPEARARGARRQQLPLLRGSSRPLRSRLGDAGRRARRALPRRQRDPPRRASPPTRSRRARP